MKSSEAYSDLALARDYVYKIGKTQEHLKEKGYLSELRVKSTIHYQPYPSASNYHHCEKFDEYLAQAIKEKFSELTQIALKKMEAKANKYLIEEEKVYRDRLMVIEKLKSELEEFGV